MRLASRIKSRRRGEIAREALVAVADDGLALLGDKLMGHLGEVLHASGCFDGERHPNHDEVDQENGKDEQFHREGVADGCPGVRRGDVDGAEQGVHRTGEVSIQKSSEQQLSRHRYLSEQLLRTTRSKPASGEEPQP